MYKIDSIKYYKDIHILINGQNLCVKYILMTFLNIR